ncbi:hypothetical protein IAD21_04749 [Abditibacteriota bacterium]|nr:hypothetical protein IAD21_04749 [Abditibacteriota bacterium]
MADYAKRVVIRAQRIQYFGCCGGCFGTLAIGIALGMQSILALRSRFSAPNIWVYGGLLLALAVALLWFFFFDIGIKRVWNQKFVFETKSFRFKDEATQHELTYGQIMEVKVEQTPDGPSHKIVFRCLNRQSETITCNTQDFSPQAVMKILRELSRRAALASIEISQLPDLDNGHDLKVAASGIGEISFDESRNYFLFTPISIGPD